MILRWYLYMGNGYCQIHLCEIVDVNFTTPGSRPSLFFNMFIATEYKRFAFARNLLMFYFLVHAGDPSSVTTTAHVKRAHDLCQGHAPVTLTWGEGHTTSYPSPTGRDVTWSWLERRDMRSTSQMSSGPRGLFSVGAVIIGVVVWCGSCFSKWEKNLPFCG